MFTKPRLESFEVSISLMENAERMLETTMAGGRKCQESKTCLVQVAQPLKE
jgi:hypothetical protein